MAFPKNPIIGQLHFGTNRNESYIYDGDRWLLTKGEALADSDFSVYIDNITGDVSIRGNDSKNIHILLSEMPERFQAYFTKYLLCKK